MTIYNFRKYIRGLLGLYLIFALTSCSYDYFEDENNFRLYVPQIADGSIQNFYVAFHAQDGSHTITRELTAPFDKDDLMKRGILKFKLFPGQYSVSCFADYAPGSITVGNTFDDSYKHAIDLNNNLYQPPHTNPRSVLTTAMAYPMGHPDSRDSVAIDIGENRRFKGTVIISFTELPEVVTRIDAYYNGLATAYHFDGTFRRFALNDRLVESFKVSDNRQGNVVTLTDIINASTGTAFGVVPSTRAGIKSSNPTSLELELHLYDSSNNLVGVIPFTENDFNSLPPDRRPLSKNGDVAEDLVLNSQETIRFNLKGFTIISIEIMGWGDIIGGGTTPM